MTSHAITTMKRRLSRIHRIMSRCVTGSGVVRSQYKYEYQRLVQEARKFKEAIEWMEALYTEKGTAKV